MLAMFKVTQLRVLSCYLQCNWKYRYVGVFLHCTKKTTTCIL